MPTGLEAGAGVTEGQILAGKYRVDKVLGVGGMGVVVAARHVELDEKVAIKFLLPEMLVDGLSVARFQREAKAAVRIKNEHVARVFDVGRLDNGAPYMVMEFLEGSDLSGLLARHGTLPVAQAVDFILQTSVAVADAHALGIIHRDLKPANLFCVRRSDGQLSIKVLDFGISKLAETDGAGMSFTQTSAMMGSPLYMSPEQFRSSKNVDTRTDIWAIGAILFELVTGKPPFTAGSVPELAIKVVTEPAPSAAHVNPAIPPALAAVISTCLERDVERRYRSVAELAVALAPFAPPWARPLVDRVAAISEQAISTDARQSRPAGAVGMPARGTSEPWAPSSAESRTAGPVQWTSPGAPRRSMLPTLGLIFGIIGLGGGGAIWWATRQAVTEETLASAAAPAVASALPPALSPSAPSVAPVEAISAFPVAAPPSQSGPHPTKPVRPPKAKRPAAPPAAAVAAKPASPAGAKSTTATATRVSCDPPFYFDAKGNRVFKQECL
jgi:serine/threonine protein kinase